MCALHWLGTELSQSSGRKQAAKPGFQFASPISRYLSQLPPACPLLAPWLLNSWPHGVLAAKGGLEVLLPSLTYSVMVRLYFPVTCDVAGSRGRSYHFPANGQQHFSVFSRQSCHLDPTSHRGVTTAALMQAPMFRTGMKLRAHPSWCCGWCHTLWLHSQC